MPVKLPAPPPLPKPAAAKAAPPPKPKPQPKPQQIKPQPKPVKAAKAAKPAPPPELPAMEEPVIYKVERSKAVFPPEPAKTVLRRVTSEPPRMGRLVAFADGRRSGGSRRRSPGKTK